LSSEFISSSAILEESTHPPTATSSLKKISIPGAAALSITFDRRCRLSAKDTLEFFADQQCQQLLASVGAIDLEKHFVPITIGIDSIWCRFTTLKDGEKVWGYRFAVTPIQPECNLALWLIQWLLSEGSPAVLDLPTRTFKALFLYLYAAQVPVTQRVVVIRLLTTILQKAGLPEENIRSSDPRKMRETLRREMDDLLKTTSKQNLSSPYLQSLVELMTEVRLAMKTDSIGSLSISSPPLSSSPATPYPIEMPLFDRVVELTKIIRCFMTRSSLPPPFLQSTLKILSNDGQPSSLDEIDKLHAGWTMEMDEQVALLVYNHWDKTGIDTQVLPPSAITIAEVDKSNYPKIAQLPITSIRIRFALLKVFNSFVSAALPLIDLSYRQSSSYSLASKLCQVRHLIFFDTKVNYLRQILTKTCVEKEPPHVTIDRLEAARHHEKDKENSKCVFLQVMHQLRNVNPALLRQKDRSFKVTLKGESAEGEVGPYREAITTISTELQSSDLPLLIPCPNQQQAKETIGVGDNRDKFVINPAALTRNHLAMFEFFGKLIGISIRSKNLLSLDLPAFVFKAFVGLPLEKKDLKDIDYSVCNSLERMETMPEDQFKGSVFETFTTLLSDRKTVAELKPGGADLSVT
jgi:hypothetical protein